MSVVSAHSSSSALESHSGVAAAHIVKLAMGWDYPTIAVSYLVAVLASYAMVNVLQHPLSHVVSILAAFGFAVGGVWSMHFLGMEAMLLGIDIEFEPGLTIGTAAIAFACSAVALVLCKWQISRGLNGAQLDASTSSSQNEEGERLLQITHHASNPDGANDDSTVTAVRIQQSSGPDTNDVNAASIGQLNSSRRSLRSSHTPVLDGSTHSRSHSPRPSKRRHAYRTGHGNTADQRPGQDELQKDLLQDRQQNEAICDTQVQFAFFGFMSEQWGAFRGAPHLTLNLAAWLIACGVCAMHYLGMEAMTSVATVEFDIGIIFGSVLIAVVASTAALYMALVLPSTRNQTVPTALVMGIAVCGLHYTGMYGLEYSVDLNSPAYLAAKRPKSVNRPWGFWILALSLSYSFCLLAVNSYLYQRSLNVAFAKSHAALNASKIVASHLAAYDTSAVAATLDMYEKSPTSDAAMATVYRTLLRNLNSYRPFLPQYLFLSSDEDWSDGEGGGGDMSATHHTPMSGHPQGGQGGEQNQNGSSMSISSGSVLNESNRILNLSVSARQSPQAVSLALAPGAYLHHHFPPSLQYFRGVVSYCRLSFVVINHDRMHSHQQSARGRDACEDWEERFVSAQQAAVLAVNRIAAVTSTSVHCVTGDTVICSWNATRRVQQPAAKMATFILRLQSALSEKVLSVSDDQSMFDATISLCGVGFTGQATCLLAGDRTGRMPTISGYWASPAAPGAPTVEHLMADEARLLRAVVVDTATATGSETVAESRLVDAIGRAGHAPSRWKAKANRRRPAQSHSPSSSTPAGVDDDFDRDGVPSATHTCEDDASPSVANSVCSPSSSCASAHEQQLTMQAVQHEAMRLIRTEESESPLGASRQPIRTARGPNLLRPPTATHDGDNENKSRGRDEATPNTIAPRTMEHDQNGHDPLVHSHSPPCEDVPSAAMCPSMLLPTSPIAATGPRLQSRASVKTTPQIMNAKHFDGIDPHVVPPEETDTLGYARDDEAGDVDDIVPPLVLAPAVSSATSIPPADAHNDLVPPLALAPPASGALAASVPPADAPSSITIHLVHVLFAAFDQEAGDEWMYVMQQQEQRRKSAAECPLCEAITAALRGDFETASDRVAALRVSLRSIHERRTKTPSGEGNTTPSSRSSEDTTNILSRAADVVAAKLRACRAAELGPTDYACVPVMDPTAAPTMARLD